MRLKTLITPLLITMSWTTHLHSMISSLPPTRSAVNTMDVIAKGCKYIMDRHRSGQTEAFYHRMLEIHLYHHGIPCLKEVECFAMSGAVPVLVGRIDLEVDHTTILELKVAQKVLPKHVSQLMKYVRSRQASGMLVQNAAVICFTDQDSFEIHNVEIAEQKSRFFHLKHESEDGKLDH
jgi:GxxExxY protein